ncbi:hypothetical protein ES703_80475 [subsurface metagenome]
MNISIENTELGQKNLFIEKEGKLQPVYSRYSPERDGTRFYQEHYERGCDFYVFIGLGLGYQIEPFVKKPEVKKLIVLEPFEGLFTKVKKFKNIIRIAENKKVEIYSGKNVQQFIQNIKSHYDYLFYNKTKVLSYPPLKRIFEYRYRNLEQDIENELDVLVNDGLTIAKFAGVWLRNFFNNIKKVGGINLVSSLYDSWKGTALITGAGPSLDRTIKHLKRKRDEFFLISTDASVKPLFRNGIRPDLICNIDPQPFVYSHFEGLNKNDLRDVPAVLSFLSFPPVFDIFQNRYVFFTLHPTTNFFPRDFLNEEVIINSQSVGSCALKIAAQMGFETIILAGFDFSYPGMRLYAKNTFFHDYGLIKNRKFFTFETMEIDILRKSSGKMKGISCNQLRTSSNLINYLSEIETIIRESEENHSVKILLWSQGAQIKGAEPIENISSREGFRRVREKAIHMPVSMKNIADKAAVHILTTTLALRNRIYKNMTDPGLAFEKAQEYLLKRYYIAPCTK